MFFLNGDFRFFWPTSIKDFATLPSAWDSSLNTGMGQSQLSSLWITSYFNFTAFFTKLGLSWNIIQLIFWVLPAIVASFLSAFFLFNYLFKNKKYAFLSGLIYLSNTYFLMILTGGQLGVSLSYSLVPLILLFFIKILDRTTDRNLILGGILLGLQVLFDPRIVYITLVSILIYLLFNFQKIISFKNKVRLLIPFLIAVLLNFFWVFPLALTKSSPLPQGFDSVQGFKFFSFADFSHALSLLHPNWPENIFGKIYFLDPKFLILPIFAFALLLFSKNKNILCFAFISLVGIFLAKGANPPFGEINLFLFERFPGMSMFRDPTKWYILIALSYSILVPLTLRELSKYIESKIKLPGIMSLIFVPFFLFSVFPIIGKIKVQAVPQDYISLEKFLISDKTFSRVLWIPKWQRFGYFSSNHPAIGREELYQGSAQKQISELKEDTLRDLSVKYIIVPDDSNGEIFIKDRKYNDLEYRKTVESLRKIKWIKEIGGFEKIHVFELTNIKDHLWSSSKNLKIRYEFISPSEYHVQLQNVQKRDLLVFSEGFDRNWYAQGSEFRIQSSKFNRLINSFILSKNGDYSFDVYYRPQDFVNVGLTISGLSLVLILLYWIIYAKNGKVA